MPPRWGREVMEQLGEALEAMVAIQMEDSPKTWDEDERRTMALVHLGLMEDVE